MKTRYRYVGSREPSRTKTTSSMYLPTPTISVTWRLFRKMRYYCTCLRMNADGVVCLRTFRYWHTHSGPLDGTANLCPPCPLPEMVFLLDLDDPWNRFEVLRRWGFPFTLVTWLGQGAMGLLSVSARRPTAVQLV